MSLLKYEIEYVIKSSIIILYKRLSTASGLSEWFADNVNSRGTKLTIGVAKKNKKPSIRNFKTCIDISRFFMSK